MQHDQQYPPHRTTKDTPDTPVARASKQAGAVIAWLLIGLLGALLASGILAGIVALWRVIL